MNSIIKEIYHRNKNNLYLIRVVFDGESYIAYGYLNGELINETRFAGKDIPEKLNPDSPEIENLVYLIKEDINEGNN
jgi:hypothetical protein